LYTSKHNIGSTRVVYEIKVIQGATELIFCNTQSPEQRREHLKNSNYLYVTSLSRPELKIFHDFDVLYRGRVNIWLDGWNAPQL